MACCVEPGLASQLKSLANQIESPPCTGAPCPQPCGGPCCVQPYAQVTITCPPPIFAPTQPCYVKPLQLPGPPPCPPPMTEEEAFHTRYSNFYNWYNSDYKASNKNACPVKPNYKKVSCNCESYELKPAPEEEQKGCPTGFLPCSMDLTPINPANPCAPWIAEVQPCPPKKKCPESNYYMPGPCTKPCCKHWKPKDGPCRYDLPCKAHCYNHPTGIKPSGRYC